MNSKCSRFAIAAMATLVVLAGFAPPAEAAMVLKLEAVSGCVVGPCSVMITDNDISSGDSNPTTGQITFVGSIGGWSFNVTTGTSKPQIGPGALALSSVDISYSGAGTLKLSLTDTGFTAPVGNLNLVQRVATSGSLPGGSSISVTGYQSNSDGEFATTNTTGAAVVDTSNPFATAIGDMITVGPGAYSLTEVATITFGASGGLVQFDSTLAFNPEPTGLVLVGGVLLFTARALRRHAVRS